MKSFLAAIVLLASFHGVARGDDAADAKALLDKVIEANGGAEALGNIVAVSVKGKATDYSDKDHATSTVEVFYEGEDKMRTVSTDAGETKPDIEVVNGKKGWSKDAGKDTEDLTGAEVAVRRGTIYLNWIVNYVPLKGKDYQLSLLDGIDVDGRKTAGLLVRRDKHDPVKLYFDAETHLLLKSEMPIKDPDSGKTGIEVGTYSDYTTVQGTKQPRKAEWFWNGVKIQDSEADTTLYDKPLDEKLFVKP